MAEPRIDETRLIDTPEGPGRARVIAGAAGGAARGSILLGHGAGGQKDSADLARLARALPADGWTVVLIDQPWRVAGKRVATLPPHLDAAYVPIARALLEGDHALPRPLVSAGRSAGARVACRTAGAVGADAVIALSFPLHPPGRPDRSRYAELARAADLVPVDPRAGSRLVVVQGQRDPFGTPEELIAAGFDPALLREVRGTHTPNPGDVLAEVRGFLAGL